MEGAAGDQGPGKVSALLEQDSLHETRFGSPDTDAWVLGGDLAVSDPIEVQFEGLLP